MKHIIIKMIPIFLVFCSCSKLTDVIDLTPPNNVDPENIVHNAAGARNMLNGVYAQLHDQYYYMHTEMVPAVMTGTMARALTLVNIQFANNEVSPDLADVRHIWSAFYKLVNHANWAIQLIDELKTAELDDMEKASMIAQARALRAMGHFDALRLYGQFYDLDSRYGVVVRTEPTDFSTRHKERSTVAEVYDLILDDLDYAIVYAPDFQKPVLFSKTAAKALKARVHLYRGEYAEAAVLAGEVIDEETRSLSPSFGEVFSTGFNSTEMIFMRATDAVTASNLLQHRKQFLYTSRHAIAGPLAISLLADDPRQPTTYLASNNTILKVDNTTFHKPTYFIRLAELYLIKAEGLARSGAVLDDAKEPLEAIVSRAQGSPYTSPATTAEELLDEIYEEIIKELCFENGADWFASIRFGKIFEVKPSVTRESQFILPIPEAEINANALFGDQNPL